MGNNYEHEMAVKTQSLYPPHQYVPWVVAQGTHSDDIQNQISSSLLNYVCQEYKGEDRSPDCGNTMVAYSPVRDNNCDRDTTFLQ